MRTLLLATVVALIAWAAGTYFTPQRPGPLLADRELSVIDPKAAPVSTMVASPKPVEAGPRCSFGATMSDRQHFSCTVTAR